jgi:1-acyl-sn-glycerol-3-phosphate acyltransferase
VAYWIVKAILAPLLRVLFRVHVEGREHIPRSGAVILAANHRSFMDSIFLPLVIRRRLTFVAKAEYFDDPKSAWFFRAVGQIPIRREGGDASERALASAMEVLERGEVFAIYPEGTRTRDGYLHRGHTGVARLALRAAVPIVPVGMIGTDEIQPTDKKLPRFFRSVTVRFGEPLDTSRFAGLAGDHRALRTLTDELMFEIQQLTGYEYVDTYATRKVDETPVAEPARIATFDEITSVPPSAVAS